MSLQNPAMPSETSSKSVVSKNCVFGIKEGWQRPYLSPDGNLYAISGDNDHIIHKSSDGGISWKVVFERSSYNFNDLFTLPNGNHLGILGNTAQNVILSPDFSTDEMVDFGDKSWRWIGSGVSIDSKPDSGIVMYAAYDDTDKRVFRSTDNAQTWTAVLEDTNIRHWHSCQVDPYTGDWWVFSGDAEPECMAYKSTDDGDTWTLIDSGSLLLKGIRAVFTENKIMWGTDEIYGSGSNIVVTERGNWNPQSIATLDGPVLGNQRAANGMCVMHTRSEPDSPDENTGRVVLTDGSTVKEVFSYKDPIDMVSSSRGGGFHRSTRPDKYNRMWLEFTDRIIGISLPFTI